MRWRECTVSGTSCGQRVWERAQDLCVRESVCVCVSESARCVCEREIGCVRESAT